MSSFSVLKAVTCCWALTIGRTHGRPQELLKRGAKPLGLAKMSYLSVRRKRIHVPTFSRFSRCFRLKFMGAAAPACPPSPALGAYGSVQPRCMVKASVLKNRQNSEDTDRHGCEYMLMYMNNVHLSSKRPIVHCVFDIHKFIVSHIANM